MVHGVREPAEWARHVEERPQLPAAGCERVSGYGVMGLTFRSGHVLGLRRWTASSVGAGFTSIWHRDPDGRWTFYESVPSSNGQPFEANRIWFVTSSEAVVEGQEVGPIGPLAEQAHLRDFYIPQRGIFAIGRVFVTRVPDEVPAAELAAEVLR